MKKIIMLVVMSTIVFAGCSKDEADTATPATDTATGTTADTSTAQEGEDANDSEEMVSIIMPAVLFVDTDPEIVIEEAKKGDIDAVANEDGTYTYNMTKETHNILMAQIETDIDAALTQVLTDNTYPSVDDITHNEGLTEFNITADKALYEAGMDSTIVVNMGAQGMIYHIMNGTEGNTKFVINVVDATTGEVFVSEGFPEGEME